MLLRQATYLNLNNISNQLQARGKKSNIPLLCQSGTHRKSLPQQHRLPLPAGWHIHLRVCLLLLQKQLASHQIFDPRKRALFHLIPFQSDVNPTFPGADSQYHANATIKAFKLLIPTATHCFSELGCATIN